jgi:hypothetical protein
MHMQCTQSMQKPWANPDAREGKAVPSFHKTPSYACHPYHQYVLDTTMHKQTQIGTEHRFYVDIVTIVETEEAVCYL